MFYFEYAALHFKYWFLYEISISMIKLHNQPFQIAVA